MTPGKKAQQSVTQTYDVRYQQKNKKNESGDQLDGATAETNGTPTKGSVLNIIENSSSTTVQDITNLENDSKVDTTIENKDVQVTEEEECKEVVETKEVEEESKKIEENGKPEEDIESKDVVDSTPSTEETKTDETATKIEEEKNVDESMKEMDIKEDTVIVDADDKEKVVEPIEVDQVSDSVEITKEDVDKTTNGLSTDGDRKSEKTKLDTSEEDMKSSKRVKVSLDKEIEVKE